MTKRKPGRSVYKRVCEHGGGESPAAWELYYRLVTMTKANTAQMHDILDAMGATK